MMMCASKNKVKYKKKERIDGQTRTDNQAEVRKNGRKKGESCKVKLFTRPSVSHRKGNIVNFR